MSKFSLTNAPLLLQLQSWVTALKNLSFSDNFRGYEWSGTIPFGVEIKFTHPLKVIPTRFVIIEAIGTNSIVKGDGKPTADFFYLKNTHGSINFTGKVLIMP